MEITFDIPDTVIQATVKDAVMRQLQQTITEQVVRQRERWQGQVEKAVDVHLAKRLTDEDLKKVIDSAVAQRVREILDDRGFGGS